MRTKLAPWNAGHHCKPAPSLHRLASNEWARQRVISLNELKHIQLSLMNAEHAERNPFPDLTQPNAPIIEIDVKQLEKASKYTVSTN